MITADPGSPCCELWVLNVGMFVPALKANALNTPPEEYDRKIKTQRNWRGLAQAVEHVV